MKEWSVYQEANKERFLEELLSLLRIPSVSAKSEHDSDVRSAAELIKKHGDNLNFEIGEVSRNSDGVYTSTMKITKNDRAFNTRINLVSPNGKIWFTSNYVDAAKNVEEL